MAKDFSLAYSGRQSQELIPSLVSNVCTHPDKPDRHQIYRDYIVGAASALNPLPSSALTFENSDIEALESDWMTIRSDLAGVSGIALRFCELLEQEPHGGWSESTDSACGPDTDQSASGTESDRNHSSRP
jgi:hypothetical protein